ncbi:MAG: GNAT family N-acetyltransferase [Candidatus Nanohalobium sp.]
MSRENKFLQDGEIILRPVEKSDAEFLRDTLTGMEVRPFLGSAPKPVSLEAEKDYIEQERGNSDTVHFLIEYQGEKAGHIFLGGLDKDYGRSAVGYFLEPAFHGQGIMTVSLKLAVKYGFETLNRHKIRGAYLDGNEASKRVMEKAGFQEEGTERDYKYVDGEWKDAHWMSILENEYDG